MGVNLVGEYLAVRSGGTGADAPVTLCMAVELSASAWSGLLSAINNGGKYVSLDLSACTGSTHAAGGGLYTDGTFDPDRTNGAGKNRIVSMILPDAAVQIAGGTDLLNPTFNGFAGLKRVEAAGVTAIGDFAFCNCTGLTGADFPAVLTIGDCAFYNCTGLAAVNFPAATTIETYAFYNCPTLGSGIRFPEVTTIGTCAFSKCTGLARPGGNFLPKALTIGDNTFDGCTNLAVINLPLVTAVGTRAFQYCSALTAVDFPAVSSIGTYAFATTGTAGLAITMGAAAPTLAQDGGKTFMFSGVNAAKNVTVRVPSGSTGNYDAPWQENFKNSGNGTAYINLSITGD